MGQALPPKRKPYTYRIHTALELIWDGLWCMFEGYYPVCSPTAAQKFDHNTSWSFLPSHGGDNL